MYRTVAVFLWTLKGCPVKMRRFAMTRVVSGFMNVPMATTCGAVDIHPVSSSSGEGIRDCNRPWGSDVSRRRTQGCLPKTTGP